MTGTTWTEIADTALEQGKPVRSVDTLALRDNPKAIANRATGAPIVRIAQPEFLTGSGNWVVPNGVTAFKVTCVGGGGGGGGAFGTSYSGGAESGGVSVKWYDNVTPGDSFAYSVGAGGAGATGLGGNNDGGSGGDTTFDTLTAKGGGGGLYNAVTLGGFFASARQEASSGGDYFARGERPDKTDGGSGKFGYGGVLVTVGTGGTAGDSGSGYGAGGSGAWDNDSSGDKGGDGAPGTIIIEY